MNIISDFLFLLISFYKYMYKEVNYILKDLNFNIRDNIMIYKYILLYYKKYYC